MFFYKNTVVKMLLACLLLVSFSAFADVHMKGANKNASFLFSWNAHSGVLVPVTPQEGIYKLTLNNVGSSVFYFSDRPNRIIGTMSPENFLKLWQQNIAGSFNKVAPNVDVRGVKLYGLSGKKMSNFVVVLSEPVYNKHNQSITYNAKLLSNAAGSNPKQELEFKNLALFFDNVAFCPTCNGPPV